MIAGIAKGAGMIEPNMATMLVYLMTDGELPKTALQPMLRRVVDRTFNCMSIDTDKRYGGAHGEWFGRESQPSTV